VCKLPVTKTYALYFFLKCGIFKKGFERFIIIVEQRNYSLYKAMDALFGVPVFSYSVLDTMNVHAL